MSGSRNGKDRIERKDRMEACQSLLVIKEGITSNMKWKEVKDLMKDEEEWAELSKLDQLECFQQYVRDEEKEVDERRRKDRATERRKDRQVRDAFKSLLDTMQKDQMIHARTVWHKILPQVKDSEEFKNMLETGGSTARELFEDRVEALQDKFNDLKNEVKDALKECKKAVELETTYEEFCEMLDEASTKPDIKTELMKHVVHQEFVQRAVRKKKDAERRQKRKEDDFLDLIYDKDFSISKVTWEEAEPRLSKHTAFKELTEERAKEVFEEWLAKEKDAKKGKKRKHSDTDSGEEGEASEGDGKKAKKEKKSKKKKDKKKKKSEARSDSE